MTKAKRLPLVCTLLVVVGVESASIAASQSVGKKSGSLISVGPNVQISRTRHLQPMFETMAAADPEHPLNLLACSIVHGPMFKNKGTQVFASRDGGRSWVSTLDTRTKQYRADQGDPDCEFGLDGTALFATLISREAQPGIHLYRSSDAGWTWSDPTYLPINDRPYIAVDRSQGKYRGRIYLNGHAAGNTVRQGGQGVFRSLDGCATLQG